MQTQLRIFLCLFLCVGTYAAALAQPIVSVHNSAGLHTKIGAGYAFGQRFWGEFRFYAAGELAELPLELALHYNLIHRERHRVYVGLGLLFDPYEDFILLPVGVAISPFSSLDRFSFFIEAQPYFNPDSDLGLLGFWGLRYRFW